MNLLVNARDAMHNGGDIIMETANVRLDETYCQRHVEAKPGEYVRLTVSDSGIGIDKGIIEHIFEPFFTTKEITRGTGLGLATVYGIVTQNGGHIEVESEPGSGTRFKLHFPRLFGGDFMEKGVAAAIEAPAGGAILLVEDDLLVRSMTKAALEQLGYSVIQAETPQDAVEICSNSDMRIDVILTDVVMPGMNGREMAERIMSARSAVKVVFMSGYAADIVAERGVVEEGFTFIQKPFNIESLNRKIAEILTPAV
jgi:CheY-like chemotaxis protein